MCQVRRDLFKPLRVHFIGEDGIDAGGVKKEFFALLLAELLKPEFGLMESQPDSNTYWWGGWGLAIAALWAGSGRAQPNKPVDGVGC